jgi:hypothetical protein
VERMKAHMDTSSLEETDEAKDAHMNVAGSRAP